jgi:putative lipoprotein
MKWLLVISLSFGARAAPRDQWLAVDKWQHFAACAVIQSVAYGVTRGKNGHSASLRIGGAAVAAIGLAREVHDKLRKGEFSSRDLVWDATGGAAAALALHAVR